jgi:rod shape-determining protein MreC
VQREALVRFYVSAALILLLIVVSGLTAHFHRRTLRLLGAATSLTYPFTYAASIAVREADAAATYVRDLVAAGGENARLRAELARLEAVERENAVLRSDNRDLRRLLRLTRTGPVAGRWVAAEVVARSPSTWFSTVVIDRGSRSGVATGDAVLAAGGLVGRVLTTSPFQSVVLLLSDPASGVPIFDVRSRDVGLLSGQGASSPPLAEFFQGTANVRKGDLIATSGLGSAMPRGLMVGRVVAVRRTEFGLVTGALVEPLADLDALDAVVVVEGR